MSKPVRANSYELGKYSTLYSTDENCLLSPEEKTIDHVHEALIQEVAELDASVSALQEELNINVSNLEDLRAMEAMLEEDYGIKKVTVTLESRCCKLRAYLAPNADTYVVNRMLEQDDFLDIMTR